MGIIKSIKNILLREVILRFKILKKIVAFLYAIKVGKNAKLKEIFFSNKQLIEKYNKLKKEGIIFIENLITDEEIDQLIQAMSNKLCVDTYHPNVGKFSLESPPLECHIAQYERAEVTQNLIVLRIANNPEVLALVQEYLGCMPVISNVNMWWSYPNRKKQQYAQFYHRDFDDIKFLKLFIYLTDVDYESGPHIYIKDMVNVNKFRRPKRLSDHQVESVFANNKIILCGKRGTTFLEDTSGIHKGALPGKKMRLILQVEYSINLLLAEDYQQKSSIDVMNLNLNHYINRHIVNFK